MGTFLWSRWGENTAQVSAVAAGLAVMGSLYFFWGAFFRAHCCKESSSSREVGRTMGGRIFAYSEMLTRLQGGRWRDVSKMVSRLLRFTSGSSDMWPFRSTTWRVNEHPELQMWAPLLQKCATATVEESVLCNQVESCCIIDPNPINVNEGITLMEWWSW